MKETHTFLKILAAHEDNDLSYSVMIFDGRAQLSTKRDQVLLDVLFIFWVINLSLQY